MRWTPRTKPERAHALIAALNSYMRGRERAAVAGDLPTPG